MLEQTFEFTAAGSDHHRLHVGTSAIANEDGIVAAFDQLVTVNPLHEKGTLRGWWREPGTPVDAPPIMMDDGPALITVEIP